MKVLIDSNVWISALIAHGLCQEVVAYCIIEHQVCTCNFIIKEIKTNLKKKFCVPEEAAQKAIEFIKKISIIAKYNKTSLPTICRNKDDNHILAAAVTLEVDCIITGDSDLQKLKKYVGIPILSPREFWSWIRKIK